MEVSDVGLTRGVHGVLTNARLGSSIAIGMSDASNAGFDLGAFSGVAVLVARFRGDVFDFERRERPDCCFRCTCVDILWHGILGSSTRPTLFSSLAVAGIGSETRVSEGLSATATPITINAIRHTMPSAVTLPATIQTRDAPDVGASTLSF